AMKNGRPRQKLNKRLLISQDGYTAYAVDSRAVRDSSPGDEEFGNFAVHEDFPRLIPQGEIWIAERVAGREAIFFLANALTRLRRLETGAGHETAYTAGENVERFLRERLNGVEYRAGRPHKRVPEAVYVADYATLADERFPVAVWLVDGNLVRSLYKTDY